jgi:hypothetical protein
MPYPRFHPGDLVSFEAGFLYPRLDPVDKRRLFVGEPKIHELSGVGLYITEPALVIATLGTVQLWRGTYPVMVIARGAVWYGEPQDAMIVKRAGDRT